MGMGGIPSAAQPCPSCYKAVSVELPKCPYCAFHIRQAEGFVEAHSAGGRGVDQGALDRLAAMAAEQQKAKANVRAAAPVTGPVAAFFDMVRPVWLEGPLRTVEIILTIGALPLMLFSMPWMMLGVKKWGRIPFLDVAITAFFTAVFLFALTERGEAGTWWALFWISLACYCGQQVLRFGARARAMNNNV